MIRRALADLDERPVSHQPKISKRTLLEAGELPALTNFSQASFRPGDRVGEHVHEDMWEIFFVRDGCGRIRIDGVESAMARDDCWVVEPGEAHEIANDGDGDLVLLYFGLSPKVEGTARGRNA